MFLPNTDEIKNSIIRSFLQKYVLRRGMNSRALGLAAKISEYEAYKNEPADIADTAEFVTNLMFQIFLNLNKQGREFTFSVNGGGVGGIKPKSTTYIATLAAAVSDGALKINIREDEIVLKFKSETDISDKVRRLGSSILCCNGYCIIKIPLYKHQYDKVYKPDISAISFLYPPKP